MSDAPPLLFTWTGDGFQPFGKNAQAVADKYFVIGERYRLVEYRERSTSTHNHHFAWLAEAWQSLPEHLADLYPSAEHLRKRALIEAGYYHEQVIDAGSNAAAIRVARGFRAHDEFVHTVIRGGVVAVRTAKSQSRRAMNREEFQRSKTAIMDVIAGMIGVARETLARAA